ncbi:PREDICTED: protein downstream neighbor of Son [Cyprinodon variegatus]|uniref:DNA replication fork stabilization factor DONSON n=1 Tax=Cyprinodon variegatus TaxID=28743 RepID=A0A3Q2D8T9_CYPVA|nr:PREDICTED: protein downstream neighbor of Son [Cyprinodon variegatus]
MAQQSDSYSACKRPSDTVRLKRKRARNAAESPAESGSSPASAPGPHGGSRSRGSRRNPFVTWETALSRPTKVLVVEEDRGDREERSALLRLMAAERTAGDRPPGARGAQKSLPEDVSLLETQEPDVLLSEKLPASPPSSCAEYPTDWSLKTRALFTSPLSLSWTEQPKAQEEAAGLSNSCRARFDALPEDLEDPRSWSEVRSAFQRCLVYWQHPSLPWLSLFPRINAERNFSGRSAPWSQDTTVQESLMKEWSISLSSLYSLLKAGLCPYFYVCSYQFTALFRTAGLAGSDRITAIISPTTHGLREAMKTEGVEFSLPLLKERSGVNEQLKVQQRGEEDDEEEKDLFQVEEDDQKGDGSSLKRDDSLSWLKEMGIQDKLGKPESISIQIQKEGQSLTLDHRPESAVCVEGAHTFNLINFLINCRSVVAAAGSQTGLPPTLLAPTAFRGATMNVLKGRSVNVKNLVDYSYHNISSLELTGPILPSSLHAITTLLQTAQKGNFSAALYTHTPTAVMNIKTCEAQVRCL